MEKHILIRNYLSLGSESLPKSTTGRHATIPDRQKRHCPYFPAASINHPPDCPGQYNAGFPESGWRTAAEYLYLFQTDQNPGTGKSKRGARDSQLVGHSGKRKRAG